MSPPPMPYTSLRRRRSPSNRSELHLGLGQGSYDESAQPGPSPPTSPAPSPTKRTFVAPQAQPNKALPPSPLTPSRAPRKAAELLGAYTSRPAKTTHFRPLPTQTLVEIERFFGDIPRKATTARRANLSSTSSQTPSRQTLGRGSTVRHRGEDGSMWLDVEEEQEFAWLMSEVFTLLPSPVPPPGVVEVLYEGSDEDQWGMEKFTSVLDMPKVKAKKVKEKRGITLDESFMDFDDTPLPGDAWSNSTPPYSDTSTAALLVPPPRTTSRSLSASPSGSDSEGSSRSSRSPPRVRNRPPPLTLREQRVNPKLPVISTTPGTSDPRRSRPSRPGHSGQALPPSRSTCPAQPPLPQPTKLSQSKDSALPHTPFTKPRRVPVPHVSPPPVPRLPSSLPPLHIDSMDFDDEVSFFEPVTPVEIKSVRRVLINRTGMERSVSGMKNGGKWFKRVVKPLAGTRI